DAPLRGDGMSATRGVLVTEVLHPVAGLPKGGRCRAAGESGADNDHRALAAIGRVDQICLEPAGVPALVDRPGRSAIIGDRGAGGVELGLDCLGDAHCTAPKRMAKGGIRKPRVSTTAMTVAMTFRLRRTRGERFQPMLAKALHSPWRRWKPKASSAMV